MGRVKTLPNPHAKEVYLKKTIRIITFILLVSAVYCGYLFALEYRVMQDEISGYSDLRETYISVTDAPIHETSDFTESPENPENRELPIIGVDFDALLQANADTVGWIMIPDTVISYPVVQTTDNTKYLTTTFEGGFAKTGTPFADKDNDMQTLDTNTIIYGHNMGTGRTDMFSTLLSYREHEFFTEHRYIWFDTIHRNHGWWKVFAVIEVDTRNIGINYQQRQFQNETDFSDWIDTVMAESIHSTDIELKASDIILTLSTCDRSKHGQHGRFLILAVQTSGHFVLK